MKKNVASQVIGAQMVSATDGSAFTGSVTCYVTGDGGTQAVGSVSSGACTHEGNGFHTYAPAQAETNYDHVAFTFVGTGAVPATVQVYTTFPQTGDTYTLANGANGFAAIKSETASILADTGTDGVVVAAGSKTGYSLAADQSGVTVGTVNALGTTAKADVNAEVDTAISDVGLTTTVTGRIDAAISTRLSSASYTAPLDAAGVRTAVGLASANLDTQLSTIDTEIGVIDGIVDDLKSGIIYGQAATGTLSTTQATTNLTGYADDQLIGRVVIWLSGDCEGEATDITDYASTGGLLTFTALTTAPGNGDTFKIV